MDNLMVSNQRCPWISAALKVTITRSYRTFKKTILSLLFEGLIVLKISQAIVLITVKSSLYKVFEKKYNYSCILLFQIVGQNIADCHRLLACNNPL